MCITDWLLPNTTVRNTAPTFFLSRPLSLSLLCTVACSAMYAYVRDSRDAMYTTKVCPDTSPRGVPVEGDDENWDFGTGAGFYVDATVEKWATNYNMYVQHYLCFI